MRIFKFRKSYRNCTSCKTASAIQAGDFLIVRRKRNTRKKDTLFSVFNLKDAIEFLLREPQEKAALPALLFPPLFPRAFYTFPNNDEYRNPGRHIRHKHGSNKSRIHRSCLSTQRAFLSLRQTMPQKLLSINPLSSFCVSSSIIPGSYTITVSPRRIWQHSDFKARHAAKYFIYFSFPGSFTDSCAQISAVILEGTIIREKSWFRRFMKSCI